MLHPVLNPAGRISRYDFMLLVTFSSFVNLCEVRNTSLALALDRSGHRYRFCLPLFWKLKTTGGLVGIPFVIEQPKADIIPIFATPVGALVQNTFLSKVKTF